MNVINLKVKEKNKIYFFNYLTGAIYVNEYNNDYLFNNSQIPTKVELALNFNNNPYSLSNINEINDKILTSSVLNIYGLNLSKISVLSFYLAKIYSNLRRKEFENSIQAINYFRSIERLKNQNNLCLPRTLFAASKSKLFKEKGVIFIGIFLPSTNLHAWIIEDGCQPDVEDKIWTNYKPIAAIY
jgi:hypothetical protein